MLKGFRFRSGTNVKPLHGRILLGACPAISYQWPFGITDDYFKAICRVVEVIFNSLGVTDISFGVVNEAIHHLTVKQLCDSVGGYYFTYQETNPIKFNPFHIGKGDTLETEKKESIKTLILVLWKKG